MDETRNILDTQYRVSLAHDNAPKDILTKTAIVLVNVLTGVLIILAPIAIVTTALGGCLIAITFGLFTFALTLIWWPFLAFLMGTSWLWLHAWYLRPILLIPGVLIAFLADIYVMLAPEPEKDAKVMKLAIADVWPLSWYLIKPPAEYYRQQVSMEEGLSAKEADEEARQLNYVSGAIESQEEEDKRGVWEIYRNEWETGNREKRAELNKRMLRWQELMKNGWTARQAYLSVLEEESEENP